MKKTILAILALILVIASASLVAADTISMTSDVDTVDYADFSDDEEEYVFEADFTFTDDNESSNDTVDVTVALSSEVSDYITITDATQELTLTGDSASSLTFEFTIDVTEGFNGGTYTDAFTITWTDDEGTDYTETADLEVESMLEIAKAYLYIDDDEDETMDDGDADDDDVDFTVQPGDNVDIYFNLVNLFDKDYREGDLTVDVTAEMDNDDFGDDIDEDFDVDIDAGEEIDDGDDYKISFEVPLHAEARDDYEMIVTFEAEDENGAEYTSEWIIVLEVERENDDVRIDSASFAQTPVCGESPRFTVRVTNYGEDRQRDMYVHVLQSELGISQTEYFDIEEGIDEDENEQNVNFYLTLPKDADAKSYEMQATLYYKDDDTADREITTFDLTCEPEVEQTTEDESEESKTEVIILGSNDEVTSQSNGATTTTTTTNSEASQASENRVVTVEKSYTIKDTQLALTIVLIVLVVLALIALLIVGLRRK